jgi:hypothetical protein
VLYWRTAWQQFFDIALFVAILVGASLFFLGMRRRRRQSARSNSKSLMIAGALAFGTALGLRIFFADALRARRTTLADQSFVDTPEKFVSYNDPAVALEAPAGWRLRFERDQRALRAIKLPEDQPQAALLLTTARLESVNLQELVDQAGKLTRERDRNADVRPASRTQVGGKPALVYELRMAEQASAVWLVDRGAGVVSNLYCGTPPKGDPKSACMDVVDRIRWLPP